MQQPDSTSHHVHRAGLWCARIAASGLALVLTASAVHAQSLADVARKEEERRKAIKAPTKVYTNQDLGPGATRLPAVAPAPAAEATPPPAAPDQQKPPEEKKDEQYWHDRITAARESLARAEVLGAALESRINALQTDFINRDDPAQKAVIAQDRQKAIDAKARTDADIEKYKKEITDIQDEARKAGVPAGWLR